MSFTSPQFLIFFVLVCGLNYVLAGIARRLLLVAASLVFIGAFNLASLLAVIFFSSFNFIAGRQLTAQKKALFYFAVAVNCLAVVLFNYLSSPQGAVDLVFETVQFKVSDFLLVVGLSFYSLQHIAYLVDIYKKRIVPETNYLDFLLASVYFPKFISGPLTLYQQIKPELNHLRSSSFYFWQGFNRLLLGLFKKMVVADRLAPSVSSIFDYNDALPGITVLAGAVLFTIQLYFDFSGYSDMAIGISKMLGIQLPENFNFPLRATSITVFWRRWHQSLIHFFTTYIFYPISFKYRRHKRQAAAAGIVVTFLISGIWHGIGFTFMVWALCHMLYLLSELYFFKRISSLQDHKNTAKKILPAGMVLILVSFSNIFFRSTSTANCLHLLSALFSAGFLPRSWAVQFVAPIAIGGHQIDHFNLLITLLFTGLSLAFERKIAAMASPARFKFALTFFVLLIIFLFGVFDNGQRFIYMQF